LNKQTSPQFLFMQSSQAENINNHFFDGYYKEIWRILIPEELTKAEIEFLIEKAGLHSESKVLDLMCGYGRHALALSRKGINVTAIDNLGDYIDEIKTTAQKENLPINCVEANITAYEPDEIFDLVICLGNNLSFFDREEIEKLFSMIASHTKQGSIFIANSWTIAEIVFKNFTAKAWSEINGMRYLSDSRVFFNPTRIEIETTIIPAKGTEEKKKAIDYIYSLNELQTMLERWGFSIKEIWSIPGKKKFTLGEPRAYIVAEKV
jgi:SAM-dependent methyltransferase